MHSASILRNVGLVSSLVLMSVAVGCGPQIFADSDALAVVGSGPPPVEAEAPPPEPEQKRVEVRDNKIVINEKVQFEVNSAKIKPESHSLLDEVAKVIKENGQIKKIEVEGHASAEGSDQKNKQLSSRRAKAVQKYLTGDGGIDKGVLSAKGYGEERPIADNETEEGRVKNRRVEFTIKEQDVTETKVEIDAAGKEQVIEEKKVAG